VVRSLVHALLITSLLGPARGETVEERWENDILPILEIYCFDCHGDGISKGDFSFDDFPDIPSMHARRESWKRVRGNVEHHIMPPLDELQPTADDRAALMAWIDEAIFPVDPDNPDPGRVTLRRLNRTEYDNTIEDLLGIRVEVKKLLPPDDTGYGFDTIGDVLTLSPAHLERFLEAARISLDEALHLGPMPFPRIVVTGAQLKGGGEGSGGGRFLYSNAEVSRKVELAEPGRYRVTVTASGQPGPEEHPRMRVTVGDAKPVEQVVTHPLDDPGEQSFELDFDHGGPKRLAVAFINDVHAPDFKDPARRDCNLLVHDVVIEGPIDGPRLPKPESHRRIFLERQPGEDDEAWALRCLREFGRRAFRRPARDGEIERYLHFIRLAKEQGDPVDQGMRLALEAMLVSPSFLFREEPQPEPDNPERIALVDEHALASRLSYFLWSTMPDERLMRLASEGRLREQLDQELERMLESPRAGQFFHHFPGQWLQLHNVDGNYLSRRHYRRYNHSVAWDFRKETELLFRHIIREDRPLTELLDADYSFLNNVLGRHYGIDGIDGKHFRKVSLEDTPRRGILSHGSFHVLTSFPTRTSPVLRGKYVLENLLDTAPPPAPAGVPELEEEEGHVEGLSLREQMERHREDPGCASCHALLDPIGFGLENYDADGSYRTEDREGRPIDASGELAGGLEFTGAEGLREALLDRHHDDFLRSVASRLLTYALGRGVDWYDKPALDRIVAATRESGDSSHAMLRAILHSVPFQYRRGER